MAEAQDTGSVLGIGGGQPDTHEVQERAVVEAMLAREGGAQQQQQPSDAASASNSTSASTSASTTPPSCLPAVVLEGFAAVLAREGGAQQQQQPSDAASASNSKGGGVEANAGSIGPDTKLYGDAARMVEVRTTWPPGDDCPCVCPVCFPVCVVPACVCVSFEA
jgi:hypothetical protein